MENFKPLSRTEEILVAIIDKTEYNQPALSRKEELLLQLKAAFDENWVW